ncbi:hypothetical protein WJX73_000035 [Symbiochloris irregularis]|uniref:Uncharacterized protein n=1 Tax=Symbiochloris irregularis TaxID=706552 RepID=A0AAW1P9L8_9CHLO
MSGGGGGPLNIDWPIWAELLLAALIVCLSAFFAGCTLGLLALDKVGLKIISEAGATEKERKNAKKILPLRERGNWLLCTLLIGNTLANSFLSILLAGVTTGILGLIISTALIVVLAEIVPQSICCRYGLVIGAKLSIVIKFFMILLSPLSYPLAWMLDRVLGEELGTVYSRNELKHLINIHVENPHADSALTREDQQLLAGALDYKEKRVSDVMTHLDKVYMLESTVRLNFDQMFQIYRSGYTRVPIFEGNKQNIVGILYTKDLILVDPDDELEISTVISFHGKAHVQYILDITPLDEVFKLFKTGHKHLIVACKVKGGMPAAVTAHAGPEAPAAPAGSSPKAGGSHHGSAVTHANLLHGLSKEVTGIITLEDVLEEVIQDEIVDESDKFMTNEQKVQVRRGQGRGQRADDVDAYLALFEHKRQPDGRLLAPEVAAISAFLVMTVKEFALFQHADTVLKGLVKQAEVLELAGPSTTASGELSARGDSETSPLYRRGEQTHQFCLILQGRVHVKAGSEAFESVLGAWTYLGTKALGSRPYTPDFDAHMVAAGGCRVLRIKADAFHAALRMAKADEIMGARAMKQALVAQQKHKGQMLSGAAIPPGIAGQVSVRQMLHLDSLLSAASEDPLESPSGQDQAPR